MRFHSTFWHVTDISQKSNNASISYSGLCCSNFYLYSLNLLVKPFRFISQPNIYGSGHEHDYNEGGVYNNCKNEAECIKFAKAKCVKPTIFLWWREGSRWNVLRFVVLLKKRLLLLWSSDCLCLVCSCGLILFELEIAILNQLVDTKMQKTRFLTNKTRVLTNW